MSDLSLLDGVLTINGVDIVGFADSENALDFPNTDISAIRRGADGSTVSGATGNFGGPVNIMLLQNSPSFKFLMTLTQARKFGAFVNMNGFYRHEVGGFSLSLLRGTITNAPTGPTFGTGAPPAKTFTIEFGRIDSNYLLAVV